MRALWTIAILLLGPIAGAVGRRKLSKAPARELIYVSNALNLVVLGAITAAVDATHGRAALNLLLSALPAGALVIWSAAIGALCIAVAASTFVLRMVLRRVPKPSIMMLLPRSAGEKLGFAALCVLIAFVEEYMYRGFALASVREWLHSSILATGLVCLSFALMHGLQDWIAILGAFAQGVVLTIPVFAVHSLAPCVASHFVVDLFSGLLMLAALQHFRLIPDRT
jgi:membrane protease YdiL (CAAX protease family)